MIVPTTLMRKRAKGQTMVIVGMVLGFGVLIGLVAIAFDGGSALLQRRVMQNSADAGALAGIQLMSRNVLISGDPNGGDPFPTYVLTDTLLVNTITSLAVLNREGAIGAPTYFLDIYYHYDDGTFDEANPVVASGQYIPDHVDGIKVVASIDNPTTFAKAIPNPILNLRISAAAAMALSPACRPEPDAAGKTLPFTRYRYSFEEELPYKGNNLCSPFVFWTPDPDVGGPGGNQNFKNKISFNTRSVFMSEFPWLEPPEPPQQLLSGFDLRNNGTGYPQLPSGIDMRGSARDNSNEARIDVENWLQYEWQGVIMTTTVWPEHPNLLGDWAERYAGTLGQNVQSPLLYAIQHAPDRGTTPISAPWPNGLGWGQAITRTVYLWGEATIPSSTSAQGANPGLVPDQGNTNCNNNPELCHWEAGWTDLTIVEQGNQLRADGEIARVRFTSAVEIQFYENINGGLGTAKCPDGTNVPNVTNASQANGIMASRVFSGPPPGATCDWGPGGGVYYRQINP